MAMFAFADAVAQGRPLTIYNGGGMARDFTFVGDVARGVVRALEWRAAPGEEAQVFNIGAGRPTTLLDFIRTLERALGGVAALKDGGSSAGEVASTFCDGALARQVLGFEAAVGLDEG